MQWTSSGNRFPMWYVSIYFGVEEGEVRNCMLLINVLYIHILKPQTVFAVSVAGSIFPMQGTRSAISRGVEIGNGLGVVHRHERNQHYMIFGM